MSSKKISNTECEFFPCHDVKDKDNFNCMFCYCPLYPFTECGGNYIMLSNGIKDCTNCILPHYNYDYIVNKLIQLYAHKRIVVVDKDKTTE
ncbi:MAG: cysteine-rich small domain-containing protein [Clostridia bacterium]|nr:cysteine-rich small domain-containing protein [Clostridia bacterium]